MRANELKALEERLEAFLDELGLVRREAHRPAPAYWIVDETSFPKVFLSRHLAEAFAAHREKRYTHMVRLLSAISPVQFQLGQNTDPERPPIRSR